MRFITFCSNSEPGDPDEYWRRRFFILGGGLAVLMLVAWLFGGGGPSKQASRTAAARASVAAQQNRNSLPGAATGQPSPGPSSSPSASPTPSPSPSPSPSAAGTALAAGKTAACAAGRVVLSLFTSQPSYRAGEKPVFRVYAVSTSQSDCQLKYGPSVVRILVTQHGKKVWDSAACPAAGRGAQTTNLTPGVPQGVTLVWNRAARGRCAGTLPPRGSGTFEAMAEADGHLSPVRAFKLPGASSAKTPAKTPAKGPGESSSGPAAKSPAKSPDRRPGRAAGKPAPGRSSGRH